MLFLKKMKGIFAAPPCIRQKACISLLLLVTWLSSRSKPRFFHCLIAQKRNVLTFVFSEGYLHHHLQLPPNLFIQKNQWIQPSSTSSNRFSLSIYLFVYGKGSGCRLAVGTSHSHNGTFRGKISKWKRFKYIKAYERIIFFCLFDSIEALCSMRQCS